MTDTIPADSPLLKDEPTEISMCWDNAVATAGRTSISLKGFTGYPAIPAFFSAAFRISSGNVARRITGTSRDSDRSLPISIPFSPPFQFRTDEKKIRWADSRRFLKAHLRTS